MSQANPLVFDGHNDTLLSLTRPDRGGGRSFFERSGVGHIDLPRAREGGFGGGLFAVYVPPELPPGAEPSPAIAGVTIELGYALRAAMSMVALLFRLEAESAGRVKVARTAGEIEAAMGAGTLATVLHFEGAEAIDPGLDSLEVFYQAGLRSLGITWSRANAFGHGVPLAFPGSPDGGPGLTDAGKALVRACNRLGVMVDLSHLNERGFWDVAALTDKPLVATHSCVHALSPSPRNLTDRQMDAIAESGGVVGVNFYVGFLRADGQRDTNTPIAEIARHVDYMARRMGVEHVALGSDFDGCTISDELRDVTGLPTVLDELRRLGYDDAALAQVAHGNWLRVLRETWGA